MTDEVKDNIAEKQEIQRVRKVTTGAWWKSAKPQKIDQDDKKKVQTEDANVSKNAGGSGDIEQKAPRRKAKRQKPQQTKEDRNSLPVSEQPKEPKKKLDADPAAPPEKVEQPEQSKQNEAKKEQRKETRKHAAKKRKEQKTPRKPSGKSAPKKDDKQAAGKKSTELDTRENNRKQQKQSVSSKKDNSKKDNSKKDKSQEQPKRQKVRLLINAEEPEECRIALVEDGRLESFHVNTVVRERTKNNIYKGRIVSIEANLQAAFVEIGTGRNGFLPFNDIHPEYYKEDISEQSRKLINQQQWKKLKIEDVLKRGQEVLVQVVKEVTGNKGANMTTYLSLPGRCLVLMPGSDSAGISRKISGEQRRSQLREIMSSFSMPEGIGYIVRTASAEITKTALQQDLRYLTGLWKEIKKRGQTSSAPALVYEDQDTVVRFLRDHFVADIQEIIVDTQESYNQVSTFIELLPVRQKKVQVRLHRGAKPIFNQNNIEEQIESIYQPQVQLPSGGSIVIDPTEALVAIDVNSGRTSQKGDFEQSIFLANMEAADELARQLRLRDLGVFGCGWYRALIISLIIS
ncbi:MAG: Rne/Rng family ribonuclease [Candidatus Electrothrix sp. AR4]|nr:Rne/Rng family ribonuclease [Candidatus Electrothrix sp. AR4]